MLSRMMASRSRCTSGGMSLRRTLPPSGRGRPVSRFHHSPRSTILRKPALRVGELAFVNDEAAVGAAGLHGVENSIERHDDVLEVVAQEKAQARERRSSSRPGSRSFSASGTIHRRRPDSVRRDHHRPVAVAHARAAGEQGVAVADVGVGVDGNGGDVQFAARGRVRSRSGCPPADARNGSRADRFCFPPSRRT